MSAQFYNFDDEEQFEAYAQEFNPMNQDRQARRKRKKKPRHVPKKAQEEIVEMLADDSGIAGGFNSTYQPSKHEAAWLLQSLQTFYFRDFITDVMAVVKGGKEASVYRCEAHTSTNYTWLAAKVYRPRMFRQLRNDKVYREGRQVLGLDGKALNEKDWRARKALSKGKDFGQALAHTSWLQHEFRTMKQLYDAGASVPEPVASGENALLMTYHGDDYLPAPTLSEVRLRPEEVLPLFEETMRNLDLLLRHDLIHGDLSAYNILYDAGKVVLIDFPQVVNIKHNPHAHDILERDVVRVCEYFMSYKMEIDPQRIVNQLWDAYGVPDANPEEVLVNILEAVEYDDEDDD